MYKVFVNQDEIILTSKVPNGNKISIYDLKEISILEIVKLVKKQKRIFLFHKNPKKLISTFAKKIKNQFKDGKMTMLYRINAGNISPDSWIQNDKIG